MQTKEKAVKAATTSSGAPRQRAPGAGRIATKKLLSMQEMVEQALDKAGGVEWLVMQAETNPNSFMSLVGKLMPKDVNVNSQVQVMGLVQLLQSVGTDAKLIGSGGVSTSAMLPDEGASVKRLESKEIGV